MNKVILLVLLMPIQAFGQIMETFESGSFSNWIQSPEGHWNTDNSYAISGAFSLHHSYDNANSGTDITGFSLNDLHPDEGTVKCSFKVRYGTEPSSSNNWAVSLMSDSDPSSLSVNSVQNGFVIGINQSGYDDTLRLWKVKGGTFSQVINSGLNWQNDILNSDAVQIIIERSQTGNWTLQVLSIDKTPIRSSSGTDVDLFDPLWFVVTYKYTSSRDRLLWLDDINIDGVFYQDNNPPEVITRPSAGDIIISEIMADPLPEVGLPPQEFVEIYNRSQNPLNLKTMSLGAGNQHYLFPEKIITPGTYAIICRAQDTTDFRNYGPALGLKSFPTLTDGGKILTINDDSGKLIHGVEYSSDWYGDDLKSEGGWSLEMQDIRSPFYAKGNWQASRSREGGTPGKENSITGNNPDNVFTGIDNVFADDSVFVKLKFSETVIDITENAGNIKIDEKAIVNIVSSDALDRIYTVTPAEPLQRNKIYTFAVKNDLTDFAGNTIKNNIFRFGLPEPAEKGNIVFNELLFNPLPGNPDYIEFYNCSEKVIDASRLLLVSVSEITGDTSGTLNLSSEGRCILPGEYFVITTDRDKVTESFMCSDADKIFEVSSLPSMPDDAGHLILFYRGLDMIDEVNYSEKMHYPLLDNYEGVALEKVSLKNGSNDKSNWHSASETSGWGTPGLPNSVSREEPVTDDQLVMSSTRITPDNDGNDDLLIINLNLKGNGNVVSATVFDETGSFVKRLTDNFLAGSESSIIWDGTADDGKLVNTGIYIMLISVFDDTGKTHKWKKVCTVIRR